MKDAIVRSLLVGTALIFSQGAYAEGPGRDGGGRHWEEMQNMSPDEREKAHEERRAKWSSMSEEEKTQFRAERKAKWDALSKEEKVKLIDERHNAMKKRMNEEWDNMSDDDKIKFAEERMKRKRDGKGRHDGPPKDR